MQARSFVLSFALVATSCTLDFGETKPTLDTRVPTEGPSSYPDDPIVSVPPVITCPSDSLDACGDAGGFDAGDDDPEGAGEAGAD
jgi:hypothetical protein